ncbi:MAG: GNAT family N-acetyltransferase [Ignavibacteriales bacterium]|nr:GNAT family N-acetyltransferase [Ignavibacteriales bacterium]
MALEVIPYTVQWKDRWDEFVLQSNNGTIFHLQRFLEYHVDREFPWHHLVFVDRKRIVAVLPAAQTGSTLESPVGASYGSFVMGHIDFTTSLDLVDAFSDYCRAQGFERTFLTPPPFIYQRSVSQDLDYALVYRGFGYDKHYISHALRVDDPNFLQSFQSTARRYIRKYLRERPISIEISDDFDSFYPILLKNKQRHDVKPTHSLEELKRLRKLFPDRLFLFLVNHRNKPIAGSLIFVCNSQVALCFYNMLLYEYEQFNPIHAVMYEVIRWARERRFAWVDIGVSQDTHAADQMTPAMSLIRFKEKFNAHGILRSTFYKRFI